MKPDLQKWENGRLTLTGDAVHAMSPTAGIGAVTAVRGAAYLVSSLSDGDGGGECEEI